MKKEKQAAALLTRSDESGFSWFKKGCRSLECVDCGIDVRFHAEGPISRVQETSSFTRENICNYEFDCSNDDGSEIAVVVEVKMYCEQLRAGNYQKEMEEVEMTLQDFKAHFIKYAKKYLIHHFNDVLSSQARRNLYEKMTVCPELATTIILASDYSAIMDGHSQDQLNQTIQLRSGRGSNDNCIFILASARNNKA